MQFTTVALSLLSIGSALAQQKAGDKMTTVHVVRVGSMNGSLAYYPNNIKAAVGDMVQFQFAPANHTVTQSNFDNACQPIAMHSPNITGIYSGFMPVTAASTTTPTYTIMVKNTTPMWLYCSQGKHCQNGMTMVINENTAANASRSLTAYAALAKQATQNLPGAMVMGGNNSTTPNTGSESGTGSGTGSGTSSGTGTGSDSGSTGTGTGSASGTSSSASSSSVPASSAVSVRAGGALGFAGMVAAGLALFL